MQVTAKLGWLLPLALIIPSFAQKTSSAGRMRLQPTQQIRKGVDAWPLIANPKDDAERKINGSIAELNADLARRLKACDANYSESMESQFGKERETGELAKVWTHRVTTTMAGPAYLSFLSTTDFFCGGAHPYGYTEIAIFDLTTGEPANPLAWFEPSAKISYGEETESDRFLERSVSTSDLLPVYRELTRHECDDTYPVDQPFLVWPDAKFGTVMIQADHLPGCCEACGIAVSLKPEQARKLGFSESFLQAIDEAHRTVLRP
jgi:hypothetical protein